MNSTFYLGRDTLGEYTCW